MYLLQESKRSCEAAEMLFQIINCCRGDPSPMYLLQDPRNLARQQKMQFQIINCCRGDPSPIVFVARIQEILRSKYQRFIERFGTSHNLRILNQCVYIRAWGLGSSPVPRPPPWGVPAFGGSPGAPLDGLRMACFWEVFQWGLGKCSGSSKHVEIKSKKRTRK